MRSWPTRRMGCGIKALITLVIAPCATYDASSAQPASTQVAAARPASPSEREFLEELPVLSVSRLPQSIADTPGAVTVFDREFIHATGYRDIGRLLRLVPGMGVVNDRGHSPWIAYHGLGSDFSNRMQVLIDGRSVYSPSLIGGADWSGLPITIDEIERIEVLRGSNSTTYGSNAFLGVVNIVTRHSSEDRGAMIGARIGERGLLDTHATLGIGSGDATARLSIAQNADHGFERLEDNQRLTLATLRSDFRLSSRDELTFWAGLNDGTRVNGFIGSPNNTNGVRDYTTRNRFMHLRWRRAISEGNELTIGAYHNSENVGERAVWTFPPLFPVFPVNFDRKSRRDNIDLQHLYTWSPSLRLAWGFEGRRDWYGAPNGIFPYNDGSARLWRVFTNVEWRPWQPLVVNAGGMLERYNGKSPDFAPRLFANWTPTPGQTLRIGTTRAYRAPSIFEERGDLRFYFGSTLLQAYIYGPGSLDPERVHSRELGWVGQFPKWNTTLDARLFREDIDKLIDSRPAPPPPGSAPLTGGTQIYYNLGVPIEIRGFELQAKSKPYRGTELLAGAARVWIIADKQEREASTPRHQYSGTWIQRYGDHWTTTLTGVGVGRLRWGGSQPQNSYWYIDARLARHFRLGGHPAEIAIGVWDLGGRRQEFGLRDAYQPRDPISRLIYTSFRIAL